MKKKIKDKESGKVLLVEDDPYQIMMYEIELKNLGYKTLAAKNKEEGLRLAREEKPGIILLDLLLGGDNGVELLKELKKEEETKNIKVVILTNFTKKGLEEECRELGALDFLIKSKYLPKEIAQKAKNYLKD